MSDHDDDKLLLRAKAGDRDSLHLLLCDHFHRLQQHVAFRVGADREDMAKDDILQDAFVHAVRDIDKCQATTQVAFFAWLKGVVDNRVRDAFKRAATKKRGGDRQKICAVRLADASSLRQLVDLLSESFDTPSVDAAGEEAIQAVQVALSSLPEDQREAIMLRHIHGLELDAVAAQLNKTPAAVRGLIHRGKHALRDRLGSSSRWFTKKQ